MGHLTQPQEAGYGAVSQLVRALCGRYRFWGAVPIGCSVLNRPLWALTLGVGEEQVLMAAAFHAQEWLTSLVCLRLCEDMGEALRTGEPLDGWDLRRALQDRKLVLVPQVNPDGVEIALHGADSAGPYAAQVRAQGGDTPGRWQANARGVDINHNFNAGFAKLQQAEREAGIAGPCARQWSGPYAESEPETRALTSLCRHMAFRHVVALHSQGEEIYWQYGAHTPPTARLMAMVLASASGYTVAKPTGLASHGGFKDWFIETYGRAGFTLELGRGTNPLPLADFEGLYRRAREMLIMALLI